jgi:uncharacterized protein
VTARSFVAWTLRHGRALWICALVLTIPATWRTATMYMHLKSDIEELLPRESTSVKAIDELRARMDGLMYLGVVVDVGDPARLPEGERFLDALAAKVRAYPPGMARAVRLGNAEERAFLEKHAPIYIETADLKDIRARIEARRDWEASKEQGALLDDTETPPSLDFKDIEDKYKTKLPSKGAADEGSKQGRWSSKKLHLTMMLVEVGSSFSAGAGSAKTLLERVQADVHAIDPDHYAPGMRVGYSGDVAISVEETTALMEDLSLSSVLVIVAVAFVILYYFRWSRSVLILVPPLLIATVFAFAIASLPPLNVTELNSNTAFLGSIIVGNGINFGIVLLARYVEERRAGRAVEDALVMAVGGARIGTFSAALAAGVSYASLALTQFRGFRQFGFIGGIGMVLSWAVAFVLMPPLVRWLDRGGKTAPKPIDERTRIMTFVTRATARFKVPIVAVGVALIVAAGLTVRHFDMSHLEYDFSKLRRADTWKTGEGYWGRRMDELLGEYLTPTVILADSPEAARAAAVRIREAAKRPPLDEAISQIRTIDDVLPGDQAAKIEEASLIREDMTPKIRSLIAPEKRDDVDRLLGSEDQTPITVDDLPRTFTTALREKSGRMGSAVLVYPRPTQALWQGPALVAFVQALRAEAGDARVAGSLPLSADILASITRDGPIASGAAFGGVFLVILLLFRFRATTVYVASALTVGVLLLAGAVAWLGVKINFANFIAFPITFGIGVDYAVNIISRWEEEGKRDILAAVRSTGSAVGLCSLTTIIGYSSLLLAENRALFLFGLVAVLGEIACLSVAVTLLPATLLLFKGRGTAFVPAGSKRPS